MKIKKIATNPQLLFPALNFFILLSAILIWLFNRGNAFQKIFSPEEYIVSDHTVVSQDVTIDSSMSEGEAFLTTPPLTLEKGIYQVLINYNASSPDSYLSAYTAQLGPLEFHTADTQLNPAYHMATMTVEVSRRVTDFTLEAEFTGSGYVSITGINITKTSNIYKKNLVYAALLCLLVNLVWLFKRADATGKKVIFALSGIFLAICYPLYTDYLTVGHDIPFHLLRIEGIAEGIRSGNALPIKIHPFWAKDYGYAVGVLYGDALLYFPAFLRLMGFSVQASYKLFVAAINLGTVIISYFSFKRMFRSRKIGVLGSLVYSASLYRLTDTYTRASVGEYCAMMFLPVILCGFYLILTEVDNKNWLKYALLTALGLTGLIQTHMLSCEIAAVLILPVCILLLRRVFRRYAFRSLVSAFILTVLLNVGFLLPFLDYYGSDLLYITSDQWTGGIDGSFQENGLAPIQLFSIMQHSNGGAWRTQAGIASEVTMGVGIFFLLVILLFGYLTLCHYKECCAVRNFRPGLLCLALGCLLLFMSTHLFPWDALVSWGSVAEIMINNLQFPWRLLSFATVLLTFAGCFAVSAMSQLYKREYYMPALTIILLLLAVNCGWYFYDFSFNNEPYRVYSGYEMNTMNMYTYEYLPAAVDPALITDNLTIQENIAFIEAYQKQGTEIICHTATAGTEGYIDFPLNYYKYYSCTDLATGEHLQVSSGYNGMLRVTFPAGFDGTIRIAFTEPWFWRLAEIISLMTLPVCGGAMLLVRYLRKKPRQQQESHLAA